MRQAWGITAEKPSKNCVQERRKSTHLECICRCHPACLRGAEVDAHPDWIEACFKEVNGVHFYPGLRRTSLFTINPDGTPSAVYTYDKELEQMQQLQAREGKQSEIAPTWIAAGPPPASTRKRKRSGRCDQTAAEILGMKASRRSCSSDRSEMQVGQQLHDGKNESSSSRSSADLDFIYNPEEQQQHVPSSSQALSDSDEPSHVPQQHERAVLAASQAAAEPQQNAGNPHVPWYLNGLYNRPVQQQQQQQPCEGRAPSVDTSNLENFCQEQETLADLLDADIQTFLHSHLSPYQHQQEDEQATNQMNEDEHDANRNDASDAGQPQQEESGRAGPADIIRHDDLSDPAEGSAEDDDIISLSSSEAWYGDHGDLSQETSGLYLGAYYGVEGANPLDAMEETDGQDAEWEAMDY